MVRLLAPTIVAVLMILIVGVAGEGKAVEKRDITITTDDIYQWLCVDNPFSSYFPLCNNATTSESSSEEDSQEDASTSSTSVSETTSSIENGNTTSATALERAHWCRTSNGTYVPLGYIFMSSQCEFCQCTQSHFMSCNAVQCMPTYCIDNSAPVTRDGQCCPQCASDPNATACVIKNISFPHGTVLRVTDDNVQCWCELGSIECRKPLASLFSGMDLFGAGTAVYVILIIICVLLVIGTLLCFGCGVFYYYYYQRKQQAIQQAHEEYYNSAGWQPMGEEEFAVDPTAEEKQVEAEQNPFEPEYPTGNSKEYIPPPYALYNGSYTAEQNEKDQKYN